MANNNFIHSERSEVTAIGNAIVHVAPDSATIAAVLSQWETESKIAFFGARTKSIAVRDFLKTQNVRGYSNMRISVAREPGPPLGPGRAGNPGYRAKVRFNVKIADLDQLDEVTQALIDAGVEELSVTMYQTSLMNEMRNDAQRQAIAAARERAELYCHEAGVTLGKVLAIDEIIVPPKPAAPPGTPPPPEPDPTDIAVSANVAVTFEIVRDTID